MYNNFFVSLPINEILYFSTSLFLNLSTLYFSFAAAAAQETKGCEKNAPIGTTGHGWFNDSLENFDRIEGKEERRPAMKKKQRSWKMRVYNEQ